MYLRGSKWNMARRTRRRSGPWRVTFLVVCILGVLYVDRFVMPSTTAFFVPTPTPTQSAESFTNQAEALFKDGKLRPAIEAYKQAIRADPKNKSNYVEMARIQVWIGQCADAQESAERALVGNENYALAHAVRGWALDCQKDFLQAEAALKTALDLDPNSALAHAYMAETLMDKSYSDQGDLGDKDKAIEQSRIAYSLAPTLMEALRARGYVLYNTTNYQESLDMYKAAINLNKRIPDLFMYLGYNYRALQDYPSAVEAFSEANSLNPGDSVPDLELSRTYLEAGDFGKAVQYAETAVKDDPQNPNRYGNLGIMYYKNDDYSKSINALKMAVEGGTTEDGTVVKGLPLDYGTVAQYYWFYGFALAKATPNRCSEAVPVFQALISGVPDYELAVQNAQYGLELCQENAGAQGTQPAVTPTSGE
jgi:tetratricopeptide (TPR) repeat protein